MRFEKSIFEVRCMKQSIIKINDKDNWGIISTIGENVKKNARPINRQ